ALGKVITIKKSKIKIYHIPSKDIYIIPLRGHILGYKNTDEFKSWTKSNPREIITNPNAIEKIPIDYAGPYIEALREYSKICIKCIIGTDADIEGCNIGLFDALPFVKQIKPNIKLSQLWLSSLQKQEILQKMNNLISPKFSWGESGEARAKIDAIIGFSATREITNTLRPLLKKFNIHFTSIGRVQTSLLYLIYLHEKRIKDFLPEPYFTIEAILLNDNISIKANHRSNPFKKKDEMKANNIYQKIKAEKTAIIVNNIKKKKVRNPPTPLNTSKALILLTKNLKISANQALKTMNDLYLNKIISYPRTDSDVYKPDFDHLQYLKKLSSHSLYGTYVSNLLTNNRIKPTKGKKDAGDHPPITPLESLELNSSQFENYFQKDVYNILTRHYLALFGKVATEAKTKLEIEIEDEPFIAQFVSLISEGFLEIAPFMKIKYNSDIIITNKSLPIENIIFNKKETKPPPRYMDTTLLKLMERNHLGTKATRPLIIQILQDRKLIYYINRQYFISDLGEFLIENLKEVWLPFLDPKFTGFIEEKFEEIKEKKKDMDGVIKDIKIIFLNLFDKFLKNKKNLNSKMVNFEKKSQNELIPYPQTSAMCPYCKNHPMKLITLYQKKRFLACINDECIKNNKSYLSVPKRGKINILKSVCAKCGFNIFKINTRKANKTYRYYLCPKCWTDGLKENINGKGFCSKCEDYRIFKHKCVEKTILDMTL
ncbi:MAG: DNA topoisomerase, partial [Promethearchaeota archaeon]